MTTPYNPTPDRWTAIQQIADARADSLPAPVEIRFRDDLGTIFISFDSAADLDAWAEMLNLGDRREQPWPLLGDYRDWTTRAYTDQPWHGWNVSASAADPITEEQIRGWVDSGQAASAAAYAARKAGGQP